MSRKIVWHCEGGHDFEMENELRPERCPLCGGRELERIERPGPLSKLLGNSKRNSERRYWR